MGGYDIRGSRQVLYLSCELKRIGMTERGIGSRREREGKKKDWAVRAGR